ncbi:N-acyl homoserine lactonase family protein [Paenibacillus sp. N1-5-1-14]|uniref:N-acyl homoserine lactonase family protein n=1 Tax=Paenibacillus radicibacter TaxID=2972488 RepID=UPI002159638B|nr:N-acyl homoserine lactonase family protein [Paenibacillus radicibacter]MCR8641044.1 N-acyl homoserine lactonase family protein [Paenibacillus radicibacter]
MNSIIHVLHTGTCIMDRAIAFYDETRQLILFDDLSIEDRIELPVSAYIIEHPKGMILFDTGWHERLRTHQEEHLEPFAYALFRGTLPEGESINEHLTRLNIQSKDIDYVILSHLHSDHVSGVKHVHDAKKIIASNIEMEYAKTGLGYIPSMWDGVEINPFEFKPIPFGPYKQGLDLYDDGSVYIVYTPGHTAGQCSLLVQTIHGWVLLVSDVGYANSSWDEGVLPGTFVSKEDAIQSMKWVEEFKQRDDCYQVIINHEPSIQPHVIGTMSLTS